MGAQKWLCLPLPLRAGALAWGPDGPLCGGHWGHEKRLVAIGQLQAGHIPPHLASLWPPPSLPICHTRGRPRSWLGTDSGAWGSAALWPVPREFSPHRVGPTGVPLGPDGAHSYLVTHAHTLHTNSRPRAHTWLPVCPLPPAVPPHPHSPHGVRSARPSLSVTPVSRCAMKFTTQSWEERCARGSQISF